MDKKEKSYRYRASIRVADAVIFAQLGDNYDELVALVNAKVESEGSSTEGEIFDLKDNEVIYRCRKQAASE